MSEVFDRWYERAGVRTGVRRFFSAERDVGGTLFPRALIPYLHHPSVQALPEAELEALLARHLYHYLTFTAHFETRVVNRAAEMIANARIAMAVPTSTRLDALKIYTDEGYHALFSLDLVAQVQDATGVAALPYDFGPYLSQLDAAGHSVLPDEPVLAQLLQVVVFETLVTSVLTDVPADPTVVAPVRDLVRDHARDEARHHAFFSAFFRQLWTQLDADLRGRTAQCLPLLVRRSLWPDLAPVRAALSSAGLTPAETEDVLHDTYGTEKVLTDVRRISRHTLRLFAYTGVLDTPGAEDAFHAAGLLLPGGPDGTAG